MKLFNWFKPKKRKQQLEIYCRNCKTELISSNSFISDTYDNNGNNHVRYKCSNCGLESDYNFDIAPVPINWLDLK